MTSLFHVDDRLEHRSEGIAIDDVANLSSGSAGVRPVGDVAADEHAGEVGKLDQRASDSARVAWSSDCEPSTTSSPIRSLLDRTGADATRWAPRCFSSSKYESPGRADHGWIHGPWAARPRRSLLGMDGSRRSGGSGWPAIAKPIVTARPSTSKMKSCAAATPDRLSTWRQIACAVASGVLPGWSALTVSAISTRSRASRVDRSSSNRSLVTSRFTET